MLKVRLVPVKVQASEDGIMTACDCAQAMVWAHGKEEEASERGTAASVSPPSAPAPGKCSPVLRNGPKTVPGSCSG